VRYFEDQLKTADQRRRDLVVASAAAGTFLFPNAENMGGKYIRRGDRLGVISDPARLIVVVLIPEESIDDVRNGNSRAAVRFVSESGREQAADIVRIMPASTTQLPSRVLSTDGGGPFALDPRAQDGLTSFEPFYRAELRVPDMGGRRIEERTYVVFRHDPQPLGQRWYRGARRLFLRRLGV
jgi:putative peptide zinc metalloprotease protein